MAQLQTLNSDLGEGTVKEVFDFEKILVRKKRVWRASAKEDSRANCGHLQIVIGSPMIVQETSLVHECNRDVSP